MNRHYTVRIELHNDASAANVYEALHIKMEEYGFTRTIVDYHGAKYHLPDAEYSHVSSDKTLDNILDSAVLATKATIKENTEIANPIGGVHFGILASGNAPRKWHGLTKVIVN